jgi:hypothetical protein
MKNKVYMVKMGINENYLGKPIGCFTDKFKAYEFIRLKFLEQIDKLNEHYKLSNEDCFYHGIIIGNCFELEEYDII